jgi:hypothetical protein
MTNLKTQEDRDAIRSFCPCCFADNVGGSWGVGTIGSHCMNCGNGSTVTLPAWAVESIREQASWVGKRYYPHEEDREAYEERKTLRGLQTVFAGRSARPIRDAEGAPEPGHWWVDQEKPGGGCVSTTLDALSEAEALEKAKTALPFFTSEQLQQKTRWVKP